jgi:hypothetical protein
MLFLMFKFVKLEKAGTHKLLLMKSLVPTKFRHLQVRPHSITQGVSMKFITKIATVALIAFAATAQAQQGERSTATIDAGVGKGGFSVTISVPKSDGPTDFAGNPGPRVSTDNGNTYGEVAFGANASDTAIVLYQVAVFRDDKANERKKPYTSEYLAQEIIKKKGFVGRAQKFDCPPPPFSGVTMSCYKMNGYTDLPFVPKDWGYSVAIISYSFRNNTQGFVFIGDATERDGSKYKQAPSFIEKKAESKLSTLVNYSKINF